MGKLQKEIDSSISELITYISSYNSFTSKGNYYKSNGILYRFGLLRRSFELFFPSLEELPKNSYECETVNVMLNSNLEILYFQIMKYQKNIQLTMII